MRKVELAFLIFLVHREIRDEAQLEAVFVNKPQSFAEGGADLPREQVDGFGRVADEEQRIVRFQRKVFFKLRLLFVGEEFRDRSFVRAVLEHGQVAEALHADGLGEFQHFLKERLALLARRGDDAAHGAALEGLEVHIREKVGQIGDDQRVAQIRLIRAVLKHCFLERDAPERCGRNRSAVPEFREGVVQHLLGDGEHVLLGRERHFKVELVKLAGRTVGARVLVAEARRDLEIFVEARHHQELLELLGRLRQGVKLALMFSGGDDVVARALRRRAGQNRGVDLGEAERFHLFAQEAHDLASKQDIVVHLFIAQV